MPDVKIFTAKESDVGLRLDKFLVYLLPTFSRSEIQKFEIKDLKNPARQIKFSDKVKMADEYSVSIPDNTSNSKMKLTSADKEIDYDILYEDDDIIVVNKPRGVAMYPGAGRTSGTLVQAVLAHTNLSTVGDEGLRPGVVHRIDKDTSGIVVLAKSDAAHKKLTTMFARHDLVRKYVAFVWGIPNWEEADISGNIARSSKNRQKMTMVKLGGKPALTHAKVVRVWPTDSISEVRCTLSTGRTHQIRVHLSAHGFPVVGDPLYGRGSARLGGVHSDGLLDYLKEIHGQLLHAEVLEFKHPITGKPLKFRARMPADMRELVRILDGDEKESMKYEL